MATNQHTLKVFFFLFLIPFLFSGCKSSKKEESSVAQENQLVSIQEQPLSSMPQNSSYDIEYDMLYQKAREIDKNYEMLKPRAEKFVDSYFPNSQIQKHQLMIASIIASGSNYLLENESNAKFYGSKAYEYKEDKSIQFPIEWEGSNWKKQGIDNNTVKKLVSMKDFIISCSNGGFDSFCKANEAFFGKGQFLDALQEYQTAMQLGLEKETLRRECYLRLCACYYKAGRKEDCEKLLLELLILDPGTSINVGDQETREKLNAFKNKYLGGKL